MPDDPSTSAERSVRRRMWLLLALIPIIAGTLWLASWPPWARHARITQDGSYVVTAAVMSWDPMQYELRRLDLSTGQTIRMLRMVQWWPNEFTADNRWLDFTTEEGRVTSLAVIRVDDFTSKTIPSWSEVPRLINGERLIRIDADGTLRILDLRTGHDQNISLPPTIANRNVTLLTPPDRILVHTQPAVLGTGEASELRLLSLGTSIVPLAEWNSQTVFYSSEHEGQFFSISADFDRLECRSLDDGRKVAEYSLAPIYEIPTAVIERILPERRTLVILNAIQNRRMFYDLETQKTVGSLPAGCEIVDVSKDESFVVIGQRATITFGTTVGQGMSSLGVLDLESFATRWMHESKGGIVTASLSPDQRQLIAAFHDGSVRIFDAKTGDVLQTYRSRAALVPVFVCTLAGFIVWCVIWVRAGVRSNGWPLTDAILLNGLIASAFIVRVNLSGSMQDASRFTYQTAQSLFASWLVLLTCWVVFGKARWSLRILAPLLGAAVTLTVVLLNFHGNHFGVWQLVIGAFVASLISTFWFSLLRRWGYSLSVGDRAASLPTQARRSIPLRDLFFITAAVGALLAVVRFVSPHMFAAREAAELALIVTTISLNGVTATWAGFARRHWIVRLLLLSLFVLAAASVFPALFPNFRNWHQWRFIAKYQAFIAIFTLGTTLIYRSRGWRLRRAARA